jgi:hypothetical protein
VSLRAVLSIAAAAIPAVAQCPMCRAAVAAGGAKAGETFDWAILVLFVPAVVMFTGVFLLSFRYRNVVDRGQSESSPR